MIKFEKKLDLCEGIVRGPASPVARGHNGWFIPASAHLQVYKPTTTDFFVEINVRSNRHATVAPIILQLLPKDARALADALMEAAGEAEKP